MLSVTTEIGLRIICGGTHLAGGCSLMPNNTSGYRNPTASRNARHAISAVSNTMARQRLEAFDERGILTFVYRSQTTNVSHTSYGPVRFKGDVKMHGPDNQFLTLDSGDWYRGVFGTKRYRVPNAQIRDR